MQIVNVGTRHNNNYIIKTDRYNILVGLGYKQGYKKFLERLKKNNIELKSIKYVVLTHIHSAHIGYLKKLLKDTDATLVYDSRSKNRLEAGKDYVRVYLSGFINYILVQISMCFPQTLHYFPAVKTNDYIDFSEQPFLSEGVKLVPLSGHTKFDLGVQVEDKMFVGDVSSSGLFAVHHFPIWLENKFEILNSWVKIINNDEVDTIIPSYGKPFSKKKLIKDLSFWKNKGVYTLTKAKK